MSGGAGTRTLARTRRLTLTLTLTLAGAGGCATTSGAAATGVALVGKAAPGFELATLGGAPLSLASMKGQVVVVDFWASWCAPCREELPALEKLRPEYEPRGVRFVAINVDEDRAAAQEAAERLGVKMPVPLDEKKAAASAYGLPTMPTSYVLDKEGVVRFVHEGFTGSGDIAKLRRELDELLK